MHWVYELRGVLPEYEPPKTAVKQLKDGLQHTYRVQQRGKNFVRDNLTLKSTAASSPLKGVPLVERGSQAV